MSDDDLMPLRYSESPLRLKMVDFLSWNRKEFWHCKNCDEIVAEDERDENGRWKYGYDFEMEKHKCRNGEYGIMVKKDTDYFLTQFVRRSPVSGGSRWT